MGDHNSHAKGYALKALPVAIAACLGVQAQAQNQAGAASLEEVIVTGTQIRGIAGPVGSVSQSLTRDDLENSPAMTVTDMVRNIPEVSALGGTSFTGGVNQQNANRNSGVNRATNLRGLGPGATLILVDSQRPAINGAGYAFFDLDTIPAIAVNSVEVVADGASATYGADAVAGVVNLQLRRNFDGMESNVRLDTADGTNTTLFSHIFGTSWDEGNLVIAFEHNQRDALSAAERPKFFTDDWSAFGGDPSQIFSSPGNIDVGGGTFFPVPAGQNGQNLLLSDLATGAPRRQDAWEGDNIMPEQERNVVLASLRHRLTDTVELDLLGWFNKRNVTNTGGGINETLSVPSTNPFSPCNPAKDLSGNPGIDCSQPITVRYNMINDAPEDSRVPVENGFVSVGLNIDLSDEWSGEVKYSYGNQTESPRNIGNIQSYNRNNLYRALGNTIGGTAKPDIVPFFNPFCDGDAFACQDPATLAYISAQNFDINEMEQQRLAFRADGPLGSSNLRMAVGGEYRSEDLDDQQNNRTATDAPNVVSLQQAQFGRNVSALFAELYVPLLDDSLELSVAARYEDYSDFGTTTNPKIGLNWSPNDTFRVRASYGESFRAPQLWEKGKRVDNIRPFNVFTFQQYGLVDPMNGTQPQMIWTSGGGGADLQPENATTYSLGFDITPDSGFEASVNFYMIENVDLIEQSLSNIGVPQTIALSPLFDQFYVYNPRWYPDRATMTVAEYDAHIMSFLNSTDPLPSGAPPEPVENIVLQAYGAPANIATLETSGIDLRLSQRWDIDQGQLWASFWATYITKFEKGAAPGAAPVDRLNLVGQPLEFSARAQFGWNRGPFTVSAFVNYTNDYELLDEASFASLGVDDSFRFIDSLTTVDLTFNYNTGDRPASSLMQNVMLNLSVQNLFDEEPPLALNVQFEPVLFDATNSGAAVMGRRMSLSVSKQW